MNILLTSVGRRTYIINYFQEALKNKGKVYASNSVLTYALKQADEYVLTPNIYNENYISFLLEYCKEHNIKAIISLFDIDLPILAKNKKLFKENGIIVVVSDLCTTQICNDKWLTYEFANKNNIKHPSSFIDLSLVINSIKSGDLVFPVIMKPRWGMGSIGIYQANNIEELHVFYNKIIKDIKSSYLKFESMSDLANSVLFQEKINGDEYGLDILNDLETNYVTTIAKQKVSMRAGETDEAVIVEPNVFNDLSLKIAHNLKHIGNLDVDCFLTANNEVYMLEMNCRFGGQYPFSHLSGVDFPKQIIEWLYGNKTDINLITPIIGTHSCKEIVPVKLDI